MGAYVGFWNYQLSFNKVRSSEPLTVDAANRLTLNVSYSF